VAADAFAAESFVLAVGLQVRTTPSRPSPPQSSGVFVGIADHELHLKKRAGASDAFRVDLFQPSYLGEGRAIGPGVDVMFRDGFDGDVIAEDLSNRVIVEALGAADRFPILVFGQEGDSIRRRSNIVRVAAFLDPICILCVGRFTLRGRRCFIRRGGAEVLL